MDDPGSALAIGILDNETIVRVIKSPYHLHKKRKSEITKRAFQPSRNGSNIISVIRQVMGDDFCKNKGVEISSGAYFGMAAALVGHTRQVGAAVVDAREDFLGHAHIEHPYPHLKPVDGEPVNARQLELLDDYYKRLLSVFTYHPDEEREMDGWHGPGLRIDI